MGKLNKFLLMILFLSTKKINQYSVRLIISKCGFFSFKRLGLKHMEVMKTSKVNSLLFRWVSNIMFESSDICTREKPANNDFYNRIMHTSESIEAGLVLGAD